MNVRRGLHPIAILCDPPRELEQMKHYAREVFDRPAEVVVLDPMPRERPPLLDPDNPSTGFQEDVVHWSRAGLFGDVEDRALAAYAEPRKNRAARRKRK